MVFPGSKSESVPVLLVSARLVYHNNRRVSQKLVQSPWGASVLFWFWLWSEFQSKKGASRHNPWTDAGSGESG